MIEERFENLEIKIAYMEELVDSLNQVVSEQQLQIMRLNRTCELLNEKILALNETTGQTMEPEIPPHY
jgi:SlyX protein